MPSAPDDQNVQLQGLVQQLNAAAREFPSADGFARYKAKTEIMSSARQILATLMDPVDKVLNYSGNMVEIVAIRALMKCRVFEHIPPSGSISLQDLSTLTGAQPSLLERLLRIVVGTEFVLQLDNGQFAHTKFSRVWPLGPGYYFQLMNDEYLASMVNIADYFSARGALEEPHENVRNPYTWHHNRDGKGTWEILASFPKRMEVFQKGLQMMEAGDPVVGFYDFGQLKTSTERVELVDVGGGQGQAIAQILHAHTELSPEKMVLQDQPTVIAMASTSDLLPKSVVKMVHDFWTPQPVKGAKAYFLRRVLHDYADEDCVRILKQLVAVMEPDSVLLVSEMILPDRTTSENFPAAIMDATMMINGGKERTEAMFQNVFHVAGLQVNKIYRALAGPGALTECVLVKD